MVGNVGWCTAKGTLDVCPSRFGCGLSKSSPRFVGFVVTSRNHVWVVVAVVVVFDGGHVAFFLWASKMKVGVGLGIDQTLTVRSRQAVAKHSRRLG